MGDVNIIGIDIAKHVFSVCCGNGSGRIIKRKRLYRREMLDFMRNQPASLVGIEACSGAHYWGRELEKMGHTVKLMPPQYVKPYVKTNKNDSNDAEGCFEAVSRPTMRFARVKTAHQQSLLQIHRVRERLITTRTRLSNQIRGFLHEFGIVIPKGVETLCARVVVELEQHAEEIPELSKEIINRSISEFKQISEEVKFYEKKLSELHKSMPESLLLATIGGVGKVTATAMVAIVSDIKQFKNGRQFSAFLGLTPRQNSTGGKTRLGGISKRGDKYLRKLLVQGAQSELRHLGNKADRRSLWLKGLLERKGKVGKVAVALANKNARIAWALLVRGGDFDREYAPKCERKAA